MEQTASSRRSWPRFEKFSHDDDAQLELHDLLLLLSQDVGVRIGES